MNNVMKGNNMKNKKYERRNMKKFSLIILGVIGIVFLFIISDNSVKIELPTDYKPMVLEAHSISDNDLSAFESDLIEESCMIPGISLKNPLEYKNKNPWFENEEVKVLPVFINNEYNLKYHEGPLQNLTREEAIEVGLLVGKKLGIDTTKYECENRGESEFIVCFPSKEKYIVKILPTVEDVGIIFSDNEEVSLPKIRERNEEKLQEKYLAYYYNMYKDLFELEQPVFEARFHRDIYVEKSYDYRVFNRDETIENTIINYSLNPIRFYINTNYREGNRGLSSISLPYKHLYEAAESGEYDNTIIEDLAKKNQLKVVGYYPLISKEEAIEKVLRKEDSNLIRYDGDITLSDIVSIELAYYKGHLNKTIQPVYKVYLDLKVYQDNLHHYELLFVPAIEGQQINVNFN